MTFATPAYSWFLLLVPVAVTLLVWWLTWRADARRRFGVLDAERGAGARIMMYTRPALLVCAIAVAVFAATRPQFGSRDVKVEERGIDIAIVIDVSNSMLATDADPSRLRRAEAEIGALLDRLQGDRVGLIIFAGDPFVRSPLTSDLAALRMIVEGIHRERSLVAAGSNLEEAVQAGHRMLRSGDAEAKAMVIVSDGEERQDSVLSAVEAARADGIIVYAAGAGTSEGSPVLDIDPGTGEVRPRVGPNGQPVLTRLNEDALRGIAERGGGTYVALAGDGRPLTRLAAEFDDLGATTFRAERSSEPIERFQIFAAIALVLLCVEMLAPLALRRSAAGAARLAPAAAAGIFVAAICSTSVADVNRRGNREYASGDYGAALAAYQTAQAMDAERDELHYNASNAFDRQGEYERAIAEAQRAQPAVDDLASRLEYVLGNHFVGAERLREAIEAYKRALIADPSDGDAKHNLELITRRLTPTPQPTAPVEVPTPLATPDAPQGGTPEPGSSGDATPEGTPGAGGGTPQPDGELSQEELQRRLEEALSGIDEEFTEEEALELLDLLAQQNRRAVEQTEADGAAGGLPDY